MMRIMVFGALLIVVAACAGPASEFDEPGAAGIATADTETGEDVEKEDKLEIPPEGSLPLSEIIANFEIAGHTAVTEVEFEDGVWEVYYVRQKIRVLDLRTQTNVSAHRPCSADPDWVGGRERKFPRRSVTHVPGHA